MNKELSKAIMERSRLRNKYLNDRREERRKQYNKQRNFCVGFLRKTKRDYYSNLKTNDICDNKKFWQTVKPLLSDKVKICDKIILQEGDNIINDDHEVSEVMNEFFANIVPNLNIAQYEPVDSFSSNITDPVLKAVEKYKNHPSIVAIKTRRENINFSFSFQKIERSEILQIISELDPKKAIQSNDIPTKVIKENCEIFADFLLSSLNKCLSEGGFPSFLKEADVIPKFK